MPHTPVNLGAGSLQYWLRSGGGYLIGGVTTSDPSPSLCFLDKYTGHPQLKCTGVTFKVPPTLVRAPRVQAKKIEKLKSGVFPEVPTKLLRGAVFGGLYVFILLQLGRTKRNLIG